MTTVILNNQIVDLIKAGGTERQKAIALIYRDPKLKNQIVDFVKKNNGSQEDGIDIFHEGIIAFDDNIRKDKYRGEGDVKGYLYSICRFIWLNKLKRNKRIVYTPENETLDDIIYDTPESISLVDEQKKILDLLLDQLGDKCKQILEMWKLSYSMEEIAQKVELKNAGVARRQRYKCYQKLLKLLDKHPKIKLLLNPS